MEALDHAFLFSVNSQTRPRQTNLSRHDGNYGVITPAGS
jgi:hypothetical protein